MPVRSVSVLRGLDVAECCYAFVISGLPYIWVSDHSSITGSTVDIAPLLGTTWGATMPTSMGARTVLRGLTMPDLREAFDEKTGMLEASQANFRLTDYDGVLADLFATEGKDSDVLSENVAPGITALGTSVAIQGGLTVNPRGRHIGLERIGPTGERGYYSCFPWSSIGPHHAVNSFGAGEEGPGPIPVSLDPINFAGRLCAVYLLYRDPLQTGVTAWPSLEDQYDAGGLLWWGKLLDRGNVDGNRVWSLSVAGPESLLHRTLNQLSFGWKPVSDVAITLTDDERYVGVEYLTTDTTTATMEVRNSVGFLETQQLSTTGSKALWISELNAILADVSDGSTVGYGPDGNFGDYFNARVLFQTDGSVYIQRTLDNTGSGAIQANLVIHERVWRILGWDPPLQDTSYPEVDGYQVHLTRITQGDAVSANEFELGGTTAAAGYWRAYLHCSRLGAQEIAWVPFQATDQSWQYNDGDKRVYYPLLEGTPIVIPTSVGDGVPVRLSIDQPFLEGQPTVPRLSTSQVSGSDTNQARYFVLRGKRTQATVTDDGYVYDKDGNPVKPADLDSEDEIQVVRGSWRALAGYGGWTTENDLPTFILEKWMDPRVYGVNRIPIVGEWSAEQESTQEYALECAPLATYGAGYANGSGGLTPTHQVLYQLLLSSGTATGWDADEATLSEFAAGLNSHSSQATDWCFDAERWDMGLAIPFQLVQDPDDAVAEFDNLPNGRDSAFNLGGFAFVGPYESIDVIESIVRPRGLAMTLRGNQYGLVYLGQFDPSTADFTITQDDLWGPQNDPTSIRPTQKIRAVGQLDATVLSYRGDPIEGDTQEEITFRARDPGAIYRSGDLELAIADLGLVPQKWGVPNLPAWEIDGRTFWEQQRSTFFSRRHFKLTNVPVSRVKGQDIRPGAKVLLDNPWPVNPAGAAGTGADSAGYGIESAEGIVTAWNWTAGQFAPTLDVLIFADQFAGLRLFMPIGKVASWTVGSAALTLESDFLEHGEGPDATRFAEPAWSGGIGEMRVRILSFDRRSWSLSSVYTIASVVGNVVTLSGAPSDILRDTDKYLIAAEWDQQGATNWPLTRGSVLVLDTLSFGSVPTKGFPLLP